jgi:hypothetical protein
MTRIDGPVHEILGVVALQWRSFYSEAANGAVEDTRLTPGSDRATDNLSGDDAVTRWESEGGGPARADAADAPSR